MHRIIANQFSPDWTESTGYRGLNENMHACEALLAAYWATDRSRYLEQALTIAERLTLKFPEQTDGRLWEHYTSDWDHDFDYNQSQPQHRFRPYGYQPGHHLEWVKLLADLNRQVDESWLVPRAAEHFDTGIELGWDEEYGGLVYTVDRDGTPLVTDKYRWPVAEGIGVAAALYEQTGDSRFLRWYQTF